MDLTKSGSDGTTHSLHPHTLPLGPDGVDRIVDRVALALMQHMFAPHELPLDKELQAKYLELAIKAIRATGVGFLAEFKNRD
jgi:hypothetical protein